MIHWKIKNRFVEENSSCLEQTSGVLCAHTMLDKEQMSKWNIKISGEILSVLISERLGRYRIEIYCDKERIGILYITYDDNILAREMRQIRINSLLE